MGLSNAAAFSSEASSLAAVADGPRSGVYGGLVGQMIHDIDARMSLQAAYTEVTVAPQDFLHGVSVVGGYVALVAGYGAVAATFLHLL